MGEVNPTTVLSVASRKGLEEIVRMLLQKGADVNAQGKSCRSALHAASRYGHEEVVRLLLDNGADVYARDKDGESASRIASENGHRKIAEMLREVSRKKKGRGWLGVGREGK